MALNSVAIDIFPCVFVLLIIIFLRQYKRLRNKASMIVLVHKYYN